MEYHYFTIEDVEMLKFNGITHLHNHLNYLIHTDKDQKFTNEDSVRNVSFIFDNKGNPKALKWTDDLGKRIELKKYVFVISEIYINDCFMQGLNVLEGMFITGIRKWLQKCLVSSEK